MAPLMVSMMWLQASERRGLLSLKDVFVVADRRGQGIGEPMMQFLAGFCARQGVGHIDWIVETARAALLRAPRSDRPAAKSASCASTAKPSPISPRGERDIRWRCC